MQLDDTTFAKYKGTELENAVDYDGSNQEIRVMKRDPKTDYCVKFSDGICKIHEEKGAEMLGDACNFYPRVTRKLGDEHVMTATLSCPEIARLMLFENDATHITENETDRFPQTLKNYISEEFDAAAALKIHQSFLDACDEDIPAEHLVARIYSASQSLSYINKNEWKDATAFMIKMADGKLRPPENDDSGNLYKILQIFSGIIHATGKNRNERLMEVLGGIERALGVKIDWETLNLAQTDPKAIAKTLENWQMHKSKYDEILRHYIKSQLSFATFPFAGLGDNLPEKCKIIIFRFTLTRLGLMALPHNNLAQEEIVKIVQSISRILDHIGDPKLLLSLFEQSGWTNDAKIRGLLMDS